MAQLKRLFPCEGRMLSLRIDVNYIEHEMKNSSLSRLKQITLVRTSNFFCVQKLINLKLECQIRINTINVTSLPRQFAMKNTN